MSFESQQNVKLVVYHETEVSHGKNSLSERNRNNSEKSILICTKYWDVSIVVSNISDYFTKVHICSHYKLYLKVSKPFTLSLHIFHTAHQNAPLSTSLFMLKCHFFNMIFLNMLLYYNMKLP